MNIFPRLSTIVLIKLASEKRKDLILPYPLQNYFDELEIVFNYPNPLVFMIQRRWSINIIKIFLPYVNIHMNDDLALRRAVYLNYSSVVELLIKYGANISVNNGICFKMASKRNNYQLYQLLKVPS